MEQQLRNHWVEYTIEAAALGTFMLSASSVAVLLDHPRSLLPHILPDPNVRRVLAGLAMGLTNIALIYSKAGRRSGAHMNPAVTLTFYRLGKITGLDTAGYIAGQFAGAIAMMTALAFVARSWLSDPAVDYVITKPGPAGAWIAFSAEAAISFGMMLVVLALSNHPRWRRWTGVAAGVLVAAYISIEAPLSGMSMNPARTFGPAIVAGRLDWLWLYFAAPLLGMFGAAELYLRHRGLTRVVCAKLYHDADSPCIFDCGYARAPMSMTSA
jgi:aquaporin Z